MEELQKQIEELKAENKKLKNTIDELVERVRDQAYIFNTTSAGFGNEQQLLFDDPNIDIVNQMSMTRYGHPALNPDGTLYNIEGPNGTIYNMPPTSAINSIAMEELGLTNIGKEMAHKKNL